MPVQRQTKKRGEGIESAERLLSAANDAAGSARNLYVTMLGLCLFISLVTGSLTDEKLLLDSGLALPFVERLDLPISTFYAVATWLLVFVHGDLLLNLALLAEKLHRFGSEANRIAIHDKVEAERLRHRLANFPFSHWLAGDRDYHFVQALIVWSTVIALPPVVLLSAQVGFLPYHSVAITWGQRFAILADLLLIVAFWPSFRAADRGKGWWQWWLRSARRTFKGRKLPFLFKREATESGALRLSALTILITSFSLFIATIPGEEWEDKVVFRLFGDTLRSSVREPPTRIDSPCPPVAVCGLGPINWHVRVLANHQREGGSVLIGPTCREGVVPDEYVREPAVHLPSDLRATCITGLLFHRPGWLNLHRNLELDEKSLDARGRLRPETVAKLRSDNQEHRDLALNEVEPLVLKGRDLRFARLDRTVLPKVDVRGAMLGGASIQQALWPQAIGNEETSFQKARLDSVELIRATLSRVNFREATLKKATLTDADLEAVKFEAADLSGATLRGANLAYAGLTGATLTAADLQGAMLENSRLTGADLDRTKLHGARLGWAWAHGASLIGASFYCADVHNTSTWSLTRAGAVEVIGGPDESGIYRTEFGRPESWANTWAREARSRYTNERWVKASSGDICRAKPGQGSVPKLDDCSGTYVVNGIRRECAHAYRDEDHEVALADFHSDLACGWFPGIDSGAAEALARRWASALPDPRSDTRNVYYRVIARKLAGSDCVKRKALTPFLRDRVEQWVGKR